MRCERELSSHRLADCRSFGRQSSLETPYFRKGGPQMGVMIIVAYRPRPGKEQMLLELTREHVPVLRTQGLATDRPAYGMRAQDGTIVEVFEWKSKEAIGSAHEN